MKKKLAVLLLLSVSGSVFGAEAGSVPLEADHSQQHTEVSPDHSQQHTEASLDHSQQHTEASLHGLELAIGTLALDTAQNRKDILGLLSAQKIHPSAAQEMVADQAAQYVVREALTYAAKQAGVADKRGAETAIAATAAVTVEGLCGLASGPHMSWADAGKTAAGGATGHAAVSFGEWFGDKVAEKTGWAWIENLRESETVTLFAHCVLRIAGAAGSNTIIDSAGKVYNNWSSGKTVK